MIEHPSWAVLGLPTKWNKLKGTNSTDSQTDRALTEPLTVLTLEHTPVDSDETTIVSVVSHSGESYNVDAHEKRCTCPDAHHRDLDGSCKHVCRARVAPEQEVIDTRTIRAIEVDPQLGENAPGPRTATSDDRIVDADKRRRVGPKVLGGTGSERPR